MQPYVSVNYQSRSGNGDVGVGWSLSATSSITLCPNTYGEDGRLAGVAYVPTDRLCLDGSHLLVVEGRYGVSGSIYRTLFESFVKVQLHGDIGDRKSYFVVTQKDGTKSYYEMPAIPLHAPSPVTWFQTLKKMYMAIPSATNTSSPRRVRCLFPRSPTPAVITRAGNKRAIA